ncbi:MAG TPA: nucleotidyltransferase family protein [Bryobacteraceae bacterium]|nr:nucleotidyltransferase family protein [Bryobacteraceae bacterium]
MRDLSRSFLNTCFRLDGRAAREQMQDSRWDWESLFAAASEEAVLPALYGFTRKLQFDESLPVPVAEFLSQVETLNAERNAAIMEEVKHAVRLLNEAGIQPVLLKGVAYLVAGMYDTWAARYLADVDLLIPETQLDQAARILIQNGFEPDESDVFAHFRHHHPPLRRHGSIHLELHRELTVHKAGVLLPVHEILDSATAFDLEGIKFLTPCPEHMMTHLIMHSQLQHPYNERIWPPLRAMYDLVLLHRRFGGEIDWNRIQDRFRAAGHYGTFVLHILRVQDALGFDPPFRVRLRAWLRLAWQRRQILRRFPTLRYMDPVYMFSIVINRRLSMLARVLRTPRGLNHLRAEVLRTHIYTRFFEDIVEGRGK